MAGQSEPKSGNDTDAKTGCKPKVNTTKLIFSITAAAVVLAEGRGVDEITLLAAVFSQLADTLNTIAAARAVNDPEGDSGLGPLHLT